MSDIGQTFEPAAIRGNPEWQEGILGLVQSGKLPNGLLFTGAQGTGKGKAALFLARACNCTPGPGIPCGTCPSCKKLAAGMHPDYIVVEPEDAKKNITIAQIRELGQQLSARPNEARYRIVVIRQAEKMNVQAQNALLKSLEEPPSRTIFVLTTTDAAALLSTILSRCRKIRFSPPSSGHVLRELERLGIDSGTAHILVRTLGTDLGQILTRVGEDGRVTDSTWWQMRCWLIRQIIFLLSGKDTGILALSLSLQLNRVEDPKQDWLTIIRTVLRDLSVFRHDASKIVNLDFFNAFEDTSQMYKDSTFLEWMTSFLETERRLSSNSGLRLTLDRFFLDLSTAASALRTRTS